MPDDRKKPTETGNDGDDGFRVDVPDDLLEEAVSAVDRRVAQSKSQVNTGGEDDEMPAELSVDMEASATEAEAEAVPDIEKMSVDELLNSGFLPDKIVGAFLEERTKAGEMKKLADASKAKIDAFLAESEAFRKRLTREKDDAVKFANEKVLKELLPVIDNIERALAHAGESPSEPEASEAEVRDGRPKADRARSQAGSIREGVEITLRQANQVLEKLGCTRVSATIGSPFDPHFHEAVTHQDNKDIPINSIAMVMQAGFLLHDRLLRPAMVAVARGGTPEKVVAAPAAATLPEATAKAPAAETPEQRLERIRKAGQAARDARLKKRAEEEAKAKAAAPAGETKETPEEKLERIRKTGQAAREARMARKKEEARAREAAAEKPADARPQETPEEKLERIRKTGQAAREAREAKRRERDRGDAQSIAAAEAKAAKEATAKGETPEQKLERIRKTGEAAREARRKKREAEEAKEAAAGAALEEEEAVAEAEVGEAKAAPLKKETPDEKLARIRKTGQAAREARRKAKEAGSARPAANPLAGPAFEDDDLDGWESTVDLIRTDKS